MDCNEFTSMLDEVERETLMPAGVRGEALQHTESCAYCRTRLAAARLLSLELHALARDDAKLQAAPRIEASLLTAFRERSRPSRRIWLTWASVAAAVVLAGWLTVRQPWRPSATATHVQIYAARSAPAGRVPSTAAATSIKPPKPASIKRGAMIASKIDEPRSHPGTTPASADSAREFIALAPVDSAYPLGDGMVLRVQLPRSAPALVGLPLGGGDMSGTVTADVVLGQDGVARAIRFLPGENGAANHSLGFTQN